MPAKIIDGKAIGEEMRAELATQIEESALARSGFSLARS